MRSLVMLATFAVAGPAWAQEATGDALVDGVTQCRTVTSDVQRLACYDRAVGDLAKVRAGSGLTVLSGEEVRQRRRSLFGLSLPDINLFGSGGGKIPSVETLDSTVTGLSVSGREGLLLTFADKSVWRTVERGRIDPKVGDTVHIKRGALGSYLGSFNRQRSIRIQRVR